MKSKNTISKNVFALGFVSFFNDFASEMVYPIIPLFLTGFLGVPVSLIGLIEGIAESSASLFKMLFGWLSDKLHIRKDFVATGYSFSTFSKILIGLAGSWPLVLLGRFVDRLGKGIRTSARDALITESTDPESRGRAFGFHRALDTAGAVVGPLVAILLIHLFNNNLRPIFFVAFIPGFLGVLLLIFFVKDIRGKKDAKSFNFRLQDLNPSFKIFLLISVVFALGNSSDAFLILRAKNLGIGISLTVFAYVLYNITYAAFSYPAGIISDKVGRRRVLAIGFVIFSIVYLLFGLTKSSWLIWLLFPIYGIYMAQTDGVGKAYISDLVEKEKLGTAFGIYQMATGICAFFSSLIAGLLWSKVSPSAPFYFGSFLALVSVVIFVFIHKNRRFNF